MIILKTILFICWIPAALCQTCQLPTTFNCSDLSDPCPNATTILSLPNTLYDCPQTLHLSAKTITLTGSFTALDLLADSVELSNIITTISDLNITTQSTITLTGNISVAGMLLIHSTTNNSLNQSNQPYDDIYDQSDEAEKNMYDYAQTTTFDGCQLDAQKIVVIGMRRILINASSIVASFDLCLYTNINVNTLSNNITNMINAMDVHGISQLDFAVFLFAYNTIDIYNSQLIAVTFSLISLADIQLQKANLNASAQSCRTNSGIGRGTTIQYQNTYCTSGSSSCGYGSISNSQLCSSIVQYFLFLTHSFPYISKGPFLSTGSGGYGYSPEKSLNGAGGGIIFMLADDTTNITNSQLSVSGGNVGVEDSLSAGSGGTLFITTKTLLGHDFNNLSAAGGNSTNNNGSGGGGLIKVSFNYLPSPNYQDSLWININQGFQNNSLTPQTYSNGIFYGPVCNPGQQAYYLGCQTCPRNHYSALGDPICRACPSSDQLEPNSESSGNSFLNQCYQFKHEQPITAWLTPGDISLLSISLYLAFLVVFTIIGAILKKKIKKEKLQANEEFKIEDVKKDIQKAKILALQLRQASTIKSHQLMYHVHRISCFGSNNQDSPWMLPLSTPDEVRKYVHPQVFSSFAESFNQQARWTKAQYWITKASLLIYPIYWYYLDRIKKRKYKALQIKLEHAKDYNLMKNHNYEDRSIITIKFSKNKDYTNCYLDFFVYQRTDTRYFTLSSPFLLYLSGEGNFLRPFYLEEGDIFFKMMFFVVNRNLAKSQEASDEKSQLFNNMVSQKKRQKNSQKLNKFIRKLNTLACTLDLSAPSASIVQVLWSLVQFIEYWNREFFNHMTVQMDLLIMISRLKGTHIGNDLQVLTNKDKRTFETTILRKLQESTHWNHTIKISLFVYNPEQEIPKEEDPQQIISQSLVSSEEDDIQPIRESLIAVASAGEVQRKRAWWMRASRLLGMLRVYMFSHQKTHFDQYAIKFLQSLFILMQTMLVFIWSIKLQLPYIFVNLVCPFLGIIWFVSDSYGFGKLYLIMNAMALLNQLVTLCIYSIVEAPNTNTVTKNIICSVINALIALLMMYIGKRAITLSKKLSLKKEDEPHKKE